MIRNIILLGFDQMVILKVISFFKGHKRDTNEASRITHLVLLIKQNKEVFGSLVGFGLLLFRVVGPRGQLLTIVFAF